MPPEYETNKDKNVKPGDSFFDYCNGTWLANNPIPTDPDINLGGLYACEPVMNQRVEELKKSIPDLGHFYDLVEHMDQTAAHKQGRGLQGHRTNDARRRGDVAQRQYVHILTEMEQGPVRSHDSSALIG